MPHPSELNDPYDCAIEMQIEKLTTKEVEDIRSFYLSSNDISESAKEEFRNKSNTQLMDIFYNSAKKALDERKEDFYHNKGVCCFSDTNKDLLMWGHYSDSYKGYCLEFYTNTEFFQKMRKVEYKKSIPSFRVLPFIKNMKEDNQIFKLFCTKAIEWKYEKEWRLLHVNGGTKYIYPGESLKAIFFGPRMDSATKEIICLIVKNQTPDVELWDSQLNKGQFKIDFTRVEYTSYIEAKRKGLVP
jgi:hypothetical protein